MRKLLCLLGVIFSIVLVFSGCGYSKYANLATEVTEAQPDALFEELLNDGYAAIGYYDIDGNANSNQPLEVTIPVSPIFEGNQVVVSFKSGKTNKNVYSDVLDGQLIFEMDEPANCLLQVKISPADDGWSAWTDKLPGSVEEVSVVEIARQYRSRKKEYKESSLDINDSEQTKEFDGWSLYDTEEAEFGPWSDWSTERQNVDEEREEESQLQYRYRTKETTNSTNSSMNGWTLVDSSTSFGDYGSWSNWSTDEYYESETREVESKTQYRYRDCWAESYSYPIYNDNYVLVDTETTYGPWSDWTSTASPSDATVESDSYSEIVGYRYLIGHYCTGNVDGAQYMTASSSNTGNSAFNEHCIYHELGWYDSLSSFTSGNGGYIGSTCSNTCWTWYIMAEDPVYQDMYRYRNVGTTYYYNVLGGWSDWSDTRPSNDSNIETRTVYRYRDRTATTTYYYERYGNWSDWNSIQQTASESKDVEQRTVYRYRDLKSSTIYRYSRWSAWSDWRTKPMDSEEDIEVETRLAYRYYDPVAERIEATTDEQTSMEVITIDMQDVEAAKVDMLRYESVVIDSATATSEWIDEDDPTWGCFAEDAIDGDYTNSWQEGVEGNGEGESITIRFGSGTRIDILKIFPGLISSEEWFYANNIPISFQVTFSDTDVYEVQLTSYGYEEAKHGFILNLEDPVVTDAITIEFLSVVEGEYKDTPLTEIEAYSLRTEPLYSDPTGWFRMGNNWYFADDSGNVLTGWQNVDDSWYYLSDDGRLDTGWILIGEDWYYAYDDGAILTDCTVEINGATCTFDADGLLVEYVE